MSVGLGPKNHLPVSLYRLRYRINVILAATSLYRQVAALVNVIWRR